MRSTSYLLTDLIGGRVGGGSEIAIFAKRCSSMTSHQAVIPNVKVEDIWGSSAILLASAHEELGKVIAALHANPVDFDTMAPALENFLALQEIGVGELRRYANISDCAGSG